MNKWKNTHPAYDSAGCTWKLHGLMAFLKLTENYNVIYVVFHVCPVNSKLGLNHYEWKISFTNNQLL
jgi:hypothetical protein